VDFGGGAVQSSRVLVFVSRAVTGLQRDLLV
jgi:hypothetical protein